MHNGPTFHLLRYSCGDGVATITLNRPEVLNACNPPLHREIQLAIEQAEQDTEVRVVIIQGAGRAFCSGSDLKAINSFRGDDARQYIKLDFTTKNMVAGCIKPVIAVMHGHVAGGGFELALACDLRVAADNTLFSLPEITLGTIPGAGGLQRLPQIVGLGIAKEWAFTGRRVDAAEAYRTGLVNHVYSLDSLEQEARDFALIMAQKSPTALGLAKRALSPAQPDIDGLVGMYHMLASQACHDTPTYSAQTNQFNKK